MRILALLFVFLFSYSSINAQVGIGTITPDDSAELDITSTSKGVLIPRLTLAQRGTIDLTDSPIGVLVYQTDNTPGFYYYDGSGWVLLVDGSTAVQKIDDLSDGKSDNDGSSVFLGLSAGASDDSSDNRNVGIGFEALKANTTGSNNTANGYGTLYSNTTGTNNTASGYMSMYNALTGNDYNVALGFSTMYGGGGNYSGSNYNVAIGHSSLYNIAGGDDNIAIGRATLYLNTSGRNNFASGYNALHNNTSGSDNIANGYQSLYSNTTGCCNVAIGREALYFNTITSSNTALGYQSLYSNKAGRNAVAIGAFAMKYANNTTTSFYNYNVAIGYEALRGSTSASNNTGNRNTAIGYMSNHFNRTGEGNTSVGGQTLYYNTTGSYNTSLGYTAFSTGSDYENSTALGYDAEPGASNTVRIGNSSVSTIGGYANWTNVSDNRFKTNIKENVVGIDFIKKLRPVTYQLDMDAIAHFNKTPDSLRLSKGEHFKANEIQSGFIAQEVEQAAQSLGYNFHGVDKPKNNSSHYGLRYAEFVVPLVKAVQEQQEIIENFAIESKDKDAKIEALEKRLERIERLLEK